MTDESRPEERGRPPYLYIALITASALLFVLIMTLDPFPALRTPLLIGISVVVPVCAFLLGSRTGD